jgi:RNA polymerase sigma-70 factor (ECF subfamily)
MPTYEEETALVSGLKDRDESALKALIGQHTGRMLATSRRITGDEIEARDCVQEAFIQAWKSISSFQGRSAIGTWLHRIVVNCSLKRVAARERRAEQSLDELLPTFDRDGYLVGPSRWNQDPHATLDRKRQRELVRRGIDQLPDSYRTIVVLRDIEGFNTRQAADMLGISTSLAKTRLHRARTALRKILEPVWAGEEQ